MTREEGHAKERAFKKTEPRSTSSPGHWAHAGPAPSLEGCVPKRPGVARSHAETSQPALALRQQLAAALWSLARLHRASFAAQIQANPAGTFLFQRASSTRCFNSARNELGSNDNSPQQARPHSTRCSTARTRPTTSGPIWRRNGLTAGSLASSTASDGDKVHGRSGGEIKTASSASRRPSPSSPPSASASSSSPRPSSSSSSPASAQTR